MRASFHNVPKTKKSISVPFSDGLALSPEFLRQETCVTEPRRQTNEHDIQTTHTITFRRRESHFFLSNDRSDTVRLGGGCLTYINTFYGAIHSPRDWSKSI